MAEDLNPGTAWLKLNHTYNCEGLEPGGELGTWRETPSAEVLRASPHVVFVFGMPDKQPVMTKKGVWYRIAYQLGVSGNAEAVEISRIEAGATVAEGAVIACMVHERWLAEFNASVGDDPNAGALRAGTYHLPSELRAIVTQAFHYELAGVARAAYHTAKGLELLCETVQLSRSAKLIPIRAASGLTASDMQRLFSAKRTIAEQFEKKLTLNSIGRACGLNRAKLTRGFRTVFGQSIAEALSEERLQRASLLLETTNKPISTIGYEAGYLNNASFARAFARRFGVCPREFRLRKLRSAQSETDRSSVAA